MDLYFTQKNGYEVFELPKEFQPKDDEGWEDWQKRVGYTCKPWSSLDTPMWEVSYFSLAKPCAGLPNHMVGVWDHSYGTRIFVPSFADLFALRVQLASITLGELVAGVYDCPEAVYDRLKPHLKDVRS